MLQFGFSVTGRVLTALSWQPRKDDWKDLLPWSYLRWCRSSQSYSVKFLSSTTGILPALINSWVKFEIYLYRTVSMVPIIDC